MNFLPSIGFPYLGCGDPFHLFAWIGLTGTKSRKRIAEFLPFFIKNTSLPIIRGSITVVIHSEELRCSCWYFYNTSEHSIWVFAKNIRFWVLQCSFAFGRTCVALWRSKYHYFSWKKTKFFLEICVSAAEIPSTTACELRKSSEWIATVIMPPISDKLTFLMRK